MATETETAEKEISADFPFESKFVEVKGSNIHYIDEGEGDTILFLHGNPTSSYLWRNIIPYLSNSARCIAPDLIGMGQSDKPDIDYGFHDSYEYLEAFIEKLDLKNLTLVLHDWGSGLGFHYANLHQDNIKAIAFMEAVYKVLDWKMMPFTLKVSFKMLRAPFFGWLMASVGNMFIKKMLPDMIIRDLTKEEKKEYSRHYPSIASRKPIRVWPKEVPLGGKPKDISELVQSYHEWLKVSEIPKLGIHVTPGMIMKEEDAEWIGNNFANTKMVNVGEGLHFIQEDHPHEIGAELSEWYKGL